MAREAPDADNWGRRNALKLHQMSIYLGTLRVATAATIVLLAS